MAQNAKKMGYRDEQVPEALEEYKHRIVMDLTLAQPRPVQRGALPQRTCTAHSVPRRSSEGVGPHV